MNAHSNVHLARDKLVTGRHQEKAKEESINGRSSSTTIAAVF